MRTLLLCLAGLVLVSSSLSSQGAAAVDTTKIGPQKGTTVPPISGVDQFGKTRTLETIYGTKGAMLVFFRSADW